MALADLVARLERDARARVDAIGARADAEVRAIEAAAVNAVADAAARRLGCLRAERMAALERDLARARRRAHAADLDARRALVARVMDRARALCAEAEATPRYLEAVAAHLDEALSYLEGLDARVRCSPAVEPALRPLADRRGVSLEVDASMGPGAIAEAVDGSVRVDNSLAARLDRLEPQLAIDLLALVDDGRR